MPIASLRFSRSNQLLLSALLCVYTTAAHAETGSSASARNVIMFIGDGMGVSTVTAARIFVGQQLGLEGEQHRLSFEHFDNIALVKTYNSNQQVSDSAGTGTALHSGVKTRAGIVGLPPSVRRGDCSASHGRELDSLVDLAEDRGMSTGVVTTARVTHATPATLYAHAADRNWESSADLPFSALLIGCRDIARQLVDYDRGDGIDVIFGGGRNAFFSADRGGSRPGFNIDLLSEWQQRGSDARPRVRIASARELEDVAHPQQVMGLFADSHMAYVAENDSAGEQPSLAAMTRRAIDILSAGGNGYFLMVEGGRIDHGHHEGRAGYALLETQAFDAAVAQALAMVDLQETLVVVTADHSHTLTISGYPTRGNPILGLVVGNDARGEPENKPTLASDGKPYTTLGYHNGPGAVRGERAVPNVGLAAVQQALVPTELTLHGQGVGIAFETHGGEDVALYATGAGAWLFGGVLEQERVFHRIVEAAGWSRN